MATCTRYPTRGVLCVGTNLGVTSTNRTRVQINKEVNSWLASTNSIHVLAKASEYAKRQDANRHQDMRIWDGIVLMARVKGGMLKIKHAGGESRGRVTLQNGTRYQVVAIAVTKDCAAELEMA